MKVRRLRVGTLEVSLKDLEADLLEVDVLRIVHNDMEAHLSLSLSPGFAARGVYELSVDDCFANPYTLPGGPLCEVDGVGVLSELTDGTGKLTLSFNGLGYLDGIKLCGWLIHDIRVPKDISGPDYELLPHGADGKGNQPGDIFTLDGHFATPLYLHHQPSNTICVAVKTDSFSVVNASNHKHVWNFSHEVNLSWLPTGYSCSIDRDLDNDHLAQGVMLPSGTVRDILTDVLIHRHSISPDITLMNGVMKRIQSVMHRGSWHDSHLSANDFNRMAISIDIESSDFPYIPISKRFVMHGFRV